MRQFPGDQNEAKAAAYLRTWPAVVRHFRLRGTLPMERRFPAPSLSSGEAFVALDRLLDQASSGPCFLRQPDVAGEVLASIEYGAQRGDYELHAWVIMPNHVHLLITPRVNVSKALGSLKAGSAKSANLLLGRAGQTFWQDESYDHFVRNDEELRRIQRYIENNPVTAGLVSKAEDYVWSSAGRPVRPPQAAPAPRYDHLVEMTKSSDAYSATSKIIR